MAVIEVRRGGKNHVATQAVEVQPRVRFKAVYQVECMNFKDFKQHIF